MARSLKIDLREIEGDGNFLCPTCKEVISPDDESGLTYDVVEIKTKEDGSMEDVIIKCKKCGSIIHLVGFEALPETENLEYLDDYLGFKVNLENTNKNQ